MKKHIVARIKNKILTPILNHRYGSYKYGLSEKQAVIMFHKITSTETSGDNFSYTLNNFKHLINEIKKYTDFISPDDLFKTDKGVLLTFDDGTKDFIDNAYPYLVEKKIPFVLFVITERIGQDGYLSHDEIISLSKDKLCSLGSHSKNHSKLRFDKNYKSEILESINKLESIVNKPIKLFAYPYGSVFAVSNKNINSLKSSSIEYAFSTVKGYLNKMAYKNKLFLPRFNGSKIKIDSEGHII